MESAAKLITAIAALLEAVVWPAAFVAALVAFRGEIRIFASRFPTFLDRVRKMKVAGVEAELDALAAMAPTNGEVTAEQTRTAAHLATSSMEHGGTQLFIELDKLCLQYDTVRRTMPAGSDRTLEMARILVKMRALGPSTSSRIDFYKSSGSAGSRLAAVAMMQMEPAHADIEWLLERFRTDVPFIFYHAALALTNAANSQSSRDRANVITAGQTALTLVRDFDGVPDRRTLDVLEALVERTST